VLEERLTHTFHVYQDGLSEMPSKKLVDRSLRVIQELWIKMPSSEI
jgi:hypothetical protein